MDTPELWANHCWLITAPSTYCQDDSVPFKKISQFVQESSSAWGIHLSPRRPPLECCLRCLHCIIHIRLQSKRKPQVTRKEQDNATETPPGCFLVDAVVAKTKLSNKTTFILLLDLNPSLEYVLGLAWAHKQPCGLNTNRVFQGQFNVTDLFIK